MDPQIVAELSRLLEAGEPLVLATLVDTRGSTPQKVGARMLVRPDGSILGTMGGGCVEAEVREAAAEAMRTGAPRVLEFTLNEDLALEYGLSCGGQEVVLVDPTLAGAGAAATAAAIGAALRENRRAALLNTVRGGEGHAVGGLTLVWEDEPANGRPGELAGALRPVLAEPEPPPRLLDLPGGRQVFVEVLQAPPEVVVVGGGHVGKAVATLASFLGYRVAVIDDRREFANRERFPEADVTIAGEIEETLGAYPLSPASAVVIVTRGHKYDYQALAAAARSRAGYVGLMGSKRKVALIYRQLLADGVPAERLPDIHAPIGLDIGAVSPREIALSIMAEVTMARLGGSGGSLKADEQLLDAARRRSRV